MQQQPIIEAKNLTISYEKHINIINSANFSINAGEFVIITGQSGSGKSTLLRSMYGDKNIDSGSLNICFKELNGISKGALAKVRQKMGIVFQDFRLINEWNIERNVMLPLIIRGFKSSVCQRQARKMLQLVKLNHKADKFPLELSGGEQQQIAVARAIAHNPQILLCDEPTGSLDEYSSDLIWALLKSAQETLKASVVVVTHNIPSSVRLNFRHFEISNGAINEVL